MTTPDTAPLLIELGTEELPPKALDELAAAFAAGIVDGLAKRGIAADGAKARTFCSPRRLAVHVPAVARMQPAQKSEVLGPYLNIGLDANGAPTPALTGFAAKNGVAIEQLQRTSDAKGERFVVRSEKPGQPTAALVPDIVAEAVKALPIPKPMRWGDHDFAFVRPAHWLVVLHGSEVIDMELFGLRSGRQSRGHRFHHPQPVHVADADAYYEALYAAKVMVSSEERRRTIEDKCRTTATAAGLDLQPVLPPALLDELVNLTEWPVPILCKFEDEYLELPHEALRATMEGNQRFISTYVKQPAPADVHAAIQEADGLPIHSISFRALSSWFFGIANIESKDPAEIRKGYERVIRPRFADAKFFYDEDRKQPLAAWQDALKAVTYQQSLGSVWDKCVRVAELARVIAGRVGVDAGLATRAAALSKCDLMSRMVGEFPELQGVMGRCYASQGDKLEAPEVAAALDEFYRPRFAGDAIADGKVGRVLAVAERLDTLAGIFAVGLKPSGNKDPFALRRAALGLARTFVEGGLDLDLRALLAETLALLPDAALTAGLGKGKDGKPPMLDSGTRRGELGDELYAFILDRLRGYYADQGFGGETFEAVRALSPASLVDFDRRLRAVADFARLPEAQALAAANKRIGNLLRQAGAAPASALDAALLEAGAERELVTAIEATERELAPLLAANDHVGVLRRLAALREPVDAWFDAVMVMAEDAAVRANRVAILARLRAMFLRVADISLLSAS